MYDVIKYFFSALLAICARNSPVTGVSLMWVHIVCKTNNQMSGDLRLQDVHVASSQCVGSVSIETDMRQAGLGLLYVPII